MSFDSNITDSEQKPSLTVAKIGGHVLNETKLLDAFVRDFAELRSPKILVHGGGARATAVAKALGVPIKIVDGRRITDAETLEIITMVYGGYVNKNLVSRLQARGCPALGLSGVDGNLLQAHRRSGTTIDYGFVGDIDVVNRSLLHLLLAENYLPVIAPITHDRAGTLLNTNADTIATDIATAMTANYRVTLFFGFEKNGVLRDINDAGSLIPEITPASYELWKMEHIISAGMIPKLDNGFQALDRGVERVIIGNTANLVPAIEGVIGTATVLRT